jgi:hypothetical protein
MAAKKKTAKKKSPGTGALPAGRPRNLVKLTVNEVDQESEDLLLALAARMDCDPEEVVRCLLSHAKHLSRVHGPFGLKSMLDRYRG